MKYFFTFIIIFYVFNTFSQVRVTSDGKIIINSSNGNREIGINTDTRKKQMTGYITNNLYIQSDTSHYHDSYFDQLRYNYTYNPVYKQEDFTNQIVDKVGGVLFRTDNWMQSGTAEEDMDAIQHYLSVLDKYNFKSVIALNERDETLWAETSKQFFRDVQAHGHEIAGHGPEHSNYTFLVTRGSHNYSVTMPGVLSIDSVSATQDRVVVDTFHISDINYGVGEKGMDILFKRENELFDYAGLNRPTYWCEGGGQHVLYEVDSSIWGSLRNGYLGGGEYSRRFYRHMGYNQPYNFIGKSEYCMDIYAEESITLTPTTAANDTNVQFSAIEVIKKITDQSAKHILTTIFIHAQAYTPSQKFTNCMDSICWFIQNNRHFIKVANPTTWVKWLYHSTTNPLINYIPKNPITGQVFEDNIDEGYGDARPDGWKFGSNDTDNGVKWYTNGGSQGSAGYIRVGDGDTIMCKKLLGVEKGNNVFTMDVKDYSGSDTVIIKFIYYYGTNANALLDSTLDLIKFPTTADWVTHSDTIQFDPNTSYIDIEIWEKSGDAYIDELVLKKLY